MKITEEIFQVGGGGLTSPGDAAIYLIHFGDEAALVDAGCGDAEDRLFRNIQKCIDLLHRSCESRVMKGRGVRNRHFFVLLT